MSDVAIHARPWKSFADQLELLKARGLHVFNEARALARLQRVGYSGSAPAGIRFGVLRLEQGADGVTRSVRTDDFMPETAFADAIELYLFDRKLRGLLVDALERIEVSLRVEVAYWLGKIDAFAHLHEQSFHPKFRDRPDPHPGMTAFAGWQQKYQALVQRSKEDFVKHYREKRGPDMPIWAAITVGDLGAVPQLLAMMKAPEQQGIAERYGVADWKVFANWVRSLSYPRNLVAHHGRVWNRNMVSYPIPPSDAWPAWGMAFEAKRELLTKPFIQLAMVRHLINVICPGSRWPERVAAHLAGFPQQASKRQLSVSDMGAPDGWEKWWLPKDRQ